MVSILLAAATNLLAQAEGATEKFPTDEVADRIEAGDASIVPSIFQWLAATNPTLAHPNLQVRDWAALDGVGRLHLAEAGPRLVEIYQNPNCSAQLREMVADAAAAVGTPAARNFLTELRDDDRVRGRAHTHVLVALDALGDQAAHDELIAHYRAALTRREPANDSTDTMNFDFAGLDDPPLADAIEAMIPSAPPAEAERMNRLVQRIRLNHRPADELLHLAEANAWNAHPEERYLAMRALAEKGSVRTIDRVKQLKPWSGVPFELQSVQNDTFVEERADTLATLHRRFWRELTAVPSTQP